jgi:hypothetical protein
MSCDLGKSALSNLQTSTHQAFNTTTSASKSANSPTAAKTQNSTSTIFSNGMTSFGRGSGLGRNKPDIKVVSENPSGNAQVKQVYINKQKIAEFRLELEGHNLNYAAEYLLFMDDFLLAKCCPELLTYIDDVSNKQELVFINYIDLLNIITKNPKYNESRVLDDLVKNLLAKIPTNYKLRDNCFKTVCRRLKNKKDPKVRMLAIFEIYKKSKSYNFDAALEILESIFENKKQASAEKDISVQKGTACYEFAKDVYACHVNNKDMLLFKLYKYFRAACPGNIKKACEILCMMSAQDSRRINAINGIYSEAKQLGKPESLKLITGYFPLFKLDPIAEQVIHALQDFGSREQCFDRDEDEFVSESSDDDQFQELLSPQFYTKVSENDSFTLEKPPSDSPEVPKINPSRDSIKEIDVGLLFTYFQIILNSSDGKIESVEGISDDSLIPKKGDMLIQVFTALIQIQDGLSIFDQNLAQEKDLQVKFRLFLKKLAKEALPKAKALYELMPKPKD